MGFSKELGRTEVQFDLLIFKSLVIELELRVCRLWDSYGNFNRVFGSKDSLEDLKDLSYWIDFYFRELMWD